MLAIVAMVGLCVQPLAISAAADPIVTVVAGTGTDGPLADGQPAAQSQLWGVSAVAVTPSGTTLVADTYHHEVRQITAAGVFQSFLGSGSAGCDPDGHLLSQPRGIVSDGYGGAYVANTLCGQIVHRDASGAITVVAGHYDPNGVYTQTIAPGMSATQAFLTQPAGLAYDALTDTLYIADQYSSRVLKVTSGQIWVVAGTGSNGYNGDDLPATSAQLNYPFSVAFHGGQLYIGDSSNARIRRVDAAGTIHTLMGTGNATDAGDGGPAAVASLSGVGGLAFAADGTLYAMAHSSGQIWSVTPDGTAHMVASVHACADGLAMDATGNLIVASACAEYVLRVGLAVAPPPPPPGVLKVGAWGDSYISGDGAPDPVVGFLAGTDDPSNRCHRSIRAFPELIAQQLHRELDFHACSGAVIRDYANPYADSHQGKNPGEPAQRDTVSKQDGIGLLVLDGNNIDFTSVMQYCATRAIYQPSCKQTYGKQVETLLSKLRKSKVLAALYSDMLLHMAAGAKLYVVGYPRFFPTQPPSSCWTGALLPQHPVFTRSDMVWINQSISELNQINKRAAGSVPGVKFVDTYDAFKGHELCNTGGKEEWMNRVVFPDTVQSFHPNVQGHEAEAKLILPAIS
jgi:hypothetical protein